MTRDERKKLAALKAELTARREECKKCGAWECGYCGDPKWNLEKAIAQLEGK
jgi:hypothetical protein